MLGAGEVHDVTDFQPEGRRGASGGSVAGGGWGLDGGAVPVELPRVDPPVIGTLAAERADIAVQPGLLGTGRIIDAHLTVLPPQHHEVPATRPKPFQHERDEVIALFEHFLHLLVVGVVRLAVGLSPVQHITVNAVGRKLGLEVAVVGAVAKGLVTVGHRPVAGVLRGKLFPGHRLDDHGRCRGSATGTADGGTLASDPVRLVLPPGIGLEITDRLLVHLSAPPSTSCWTALLFCSISRISSSASSTISLNSSKETILASQGNRVTNRS